MRNSPPTLQPQAPASAGLKIEQLTSIGQMHDVEQLQGMIWGSEASWVVPSHLLFIVADYGGILLGAYVDDVLVGFVLGLLGKRDAKLMHASHMLGILPDFQGFGIGASLKRAQRDVALKQGLDLMMWTFDPLESRNGYFNLHKLGACCRSYRADYYGAMRDALNNGLPSDRLIVEWELRAKADRRPRGDATPIVRETTTGVEVDLEPLAAGAPVAIAVPADIHAVRKSRPERALDWRLAVRKAFMTAFERGYVARDFQDGAHILYSSSRSES